jgi:hypothetical protein
MQSKKRIHLQQFGIIHLPNPDLTYIRNPERNKIMYVPFHLLKNLHQESFSILYFFFTLPPRGKQRWQPRSARLVQGGVGGREPWRTAGWGRTARSMGFLLFFLFFPKNYAKSIARKTFAVHSCSGSQRRGPLPAKVCFRGRPSANLLPTSFCASPGALDSHSHSILSISHSDFCKDDY